MSRKDMVELIETLKKINKDYGHDPVIARIKRNEVLAEFIIEGVCGKPDTQTSGELANEGITYG